ncbi:MAG: maleylpyruvate isomerase N-terminal domain-containing protein, partial [Frankiales bacterium]|nr:maleylpyruvate isomerase N-terminal domain-containing protein [Frankiales bacterium]
MPEAFANASRPPPAALGVGDALGGADDAVVVAVGAALVGTDVVGVVDAPFDPPDEHAASVSAATQSAAPEEAVRVPRDRMEENIGVCARSAWLAGRMHSAEMLAQLASDGAALRDAATDLNANVPTCPGWTVRDAVEHTAVVYAHKATIVEEGL